MAGNSPQIKRLQPFLRIRALLYCSFLLRVYLGSRLEDPELLSWRQRRIQRDNHHGTTAVRQMLSDVPARSRQSLDLLLTRHEH